MAPNVRNRFACKCLTVFLACQMASCGMLLYPERRGQPAGRLDAGVVALDAVGLLLFLVPGVVAFAVDFATGTIYLPPERPNFYSVAGGQPLHTVRVNPADLTSQRLEAIVKEQTGQPIRLQPGTYQAARISEIQEFTPDVLKGLQANPVMTNVIFRGSAE
jgi:hypothetical protein